MSSKTNSQFVVASMTEFISVWAMGGKASLSLTTSGGLVTMGFNCTIGAPGAPHSLPSAPSPPPPSPPRRPRHRGPAEKEKNRQRAARHQAALAQTAAPADIPSTTSADSVITPGSLPTAPVEVAASDPVNSSISVANASVTLSTSYLTESESEPEAAANPLACDMCGFEAVSGVGLKMHISRKHEEIPQLDGESPDERDTDCWWIDQRNEPLKCFQMFIDVLKDIDESTLSEQEKTEEREKVTNGRKSAFGDNFKWFPPWYKA